MSYLQTLIIWAHAAELIGNVDFCTIFREMLCKLNITFYNVFTILQVRLGSSTVILPTYMYPHTSHIHVLYTYMHPHMCTYMHPHHCPHTYHPHTNHTHVSTYCPPHMHPHTDHTHALTYCTHMHTRTVKKISIPVGFFLLFEYLFLKSQQWSSKLQNFLWIRIYWRLLKQWPLSKALERIQIWTSWRSQVLTGLSHISFEKLLCDLCLK